MKITLEKIKKLRKFRGDLHRKDWVNLQNCLDEIERLRKLISCMDYLVVQTRWYASQLIEPHDLSNVKAHKQYLKDNHKKVSKKGFRLTNKTKDK